MGNVCVRRRVACRPYSRSVVAPRAAVGIEPRPHCKEWPTSLPLWWHVTCRYTSPYACMMVALSWLQCTRVEAPLLLRAATVGIGMAASDARRTAEDRLRRFPEDMHAASAAWPGTRDACIDAIMAACACRVAASTNVADPAAAAAAQADAADADARADDALRDAVRVGNAIADETRLPNRVACADVDRLVVVAALDEEIAARRAHVAGWSSRGAPPLVGWMACAVWCSPGCAGVFLVARPTKLTTPALPCVVGCPAGRASRRADPRVRQRQPTGLSTTPPPWPLSPMGRAARSTRRSPSRRHGRWSSGRCWRCWGSPSGWRCYSRRRVRRRLRSASAATRASLSSTSCWPQGDSHSQRRSSQSFPSRGFCTKQHHCWRGSHSYWRSSWPSLRVCAG